MPKRNDDFDDPIICTCTDMRQSQLVEKIQQCSDRFESFLETSEAGRKCTACMLDLEYLFTTTPRTGQTTAAEQIVETRKFSPGKKEIYKAIDSVAPLWPVYLVDNAPVLKGPDIQTFVTVANDSLMFEGKEQGPDFDVKITIRNGAGRIVHSKRYKVAKNDCLKLEASAFLDDNTEAPHLLVIGSVQIARTGAKPGVRGTTRPQIEICGPAGTAAVHSHGPGSTLTTKRWFTVPRRPDCDRIFLSAINLENKTLTWDMSNHSAMNAMSAEDVWEGATAETSLSIPPHGAKLFEVDLGQQREEPGEHLELFTIENTFDRFYNLQLLVADRSCQSFSVDHVSG